MHHIINLKKIQKNIFLNICHLENFFCWFFCNITKVHDSAFSVQKIIHRKLIKNYFHVSGIWEKCKPMSLWGIQVENEGPFKNVLN